MMNNKCNSPVRIWGRAPRQKLWQRCLDMLQHMFVLTAFVLFLSFVQSVTAAQCDNEQGQDRYVKR